MKLCLNFDFFATCGSRGSSLLFLKFCKTCVFASSSFFLGETECNYVDQYSILMLCVSIFK